MRGSQSMTLLLVLWSLLAAHQVASAAKIEGLIVFGDSLSDAGRSNTSFGVWYFNNNTSPKNSNGFDNGRSQNGQTWSEFVTRRRHLDLQSYAATGCSTSEASQHRKDVLEYSTTLDGMISIYRNMSSQVKTTGPQAVVIAVGRHDLWDAFLQTNYSAPNPKFQNTTMYVKSIGDITLDRADQLLASGTTHLIIGNVPPIDQSPEGVIAKRFIPTAIAQFPGAIQTINDALAKGVKALQAKYPSAKVVYWDIRAFFLKVAANPQKYDISNTNDACLVLTTNAFTDPAAMVASICYNPQDYMYWTAAIPTVTFQKALARDFERLLKNKNFL